MKVFPEPMLDQMRLEKDPPADLVIAKLFESGQHQLFHRFLKEDLPNKGVLPKGYPLYFRQFYKQQGQTPDWADYGKLERAAVFFSNETSEIMGLLGALSLPYCYTAADGAQVLYISERIKKDTLKRLAETGGFVFDVMQKGGFGPEGKSVGVILKIRLIHAAVRYHILKSGTWDMKWGEPVNQEDMVGTNLAFSLILLRGLRKIGKKIDAVSADSYLHFWQVTGYLLGIKEELLPANGKEAYLLSDKIDKRHCRPSEAGKELTKSLLSAFEQTIPASMPQGYITSYMRFLLGDRHADILGLPPSNWTLRIIKNLKIINQLGTALRVTAKGYDHKNVSKSKKMALAGVDPALQYKIK